MREIDRQLLDAANAGDERGVIDALAQGADPNAKGLCGRSAAMRAALRGDQGSLRALLGAGADPLAVDEAGRTCLMYAALGRGECFKALLAAGADPAALDGAGESALDYAAASQFEPMLKELLELGAAPIKARAIWLEAQACGWQGVASIAKAWLDALDRH